MTRWQRFLHNLGLCPKSLMGYTCHGHDGECGWEDGL